MILFVFEIHLFRYYTILHTIIVLVLFSQVFTGYAELARFVSIIFILAQVILLIDFAYAYVLMIFVILAKYAVYAHV